MAEIYLAGGCFWGLEEYIKLIRGVASTKVGYANGKTESPTYQDVCYNNTGHAEAVKIIYDEKVLPLDFLLELFYEAIDPTTINRQGGDTGTQYRTGIYFTDLNDLPVIKHSLENLQKKHNTPIAIEALPLLNFYDAEEYHQKYLDKNPSGYCHIGKDKFKKAASAIVNPAKFSFPEEAELKKELTEIQYAVTQKNATEPPFKNEYWDNYKEGIYVDVTTGEPLFSSSEKFESGCGWPNFSKPIDSFVVKEKSDISHDMIRNEVRSRVGNSHLGHVFDDGPSENGGLRYCINSASLRFVAKADMEQEGYGYLLGVLKF